MHVAFLSLNAYDMLTGGHEGNVGGSQLQQALIAEELADRGHEVTFVENDAPFKEATAVNGVRVVLKDEHSDRSLPVRLPARVASTLRTLSEIGPDAVYARVPNLDIFPVAAYCSVTDTRFVYNFAHDSELTDDPMVFDGSLSDNAVYWGLMQKALGSADVLVAQNDFQYTRARERFPGTNVSLVWNGYPDPESGGDSGRDPDSRTDRSDDAPTKVLWVATLREWKQPEVVLELAAEIPDAEFVVVGGRASESPDLYDSFRAAANETENVRFEGFVPYENVDEYFARADVFLNTSTDEGFPNTFLQSWANRTAVVSLNVDPNDILRENDIGYCADGSVDEMAERLGELVRDDERRRRYLTNAYEYFVENHSIEQVTDQYEAALRGEL
ncbi:glycosyltransferase family 4 protein [Halorussus caseinilyticus]|uniref:Glycosyltransferase family 4 protein n=1 Tax=Halorussus caseinilyticus TaxID=3034025 RepID=A0ABD5WT51_9EURY